MISWTKYFLITLMIILLTNLAFAIESTDPNDYLIWDDGEILANGFTNASNGDSLFIGGWSITGGTTIYSDGESTFTPNETLMMYKSASLGNARRFSGNHVGNISMSFRWGDDNDDVGQAYLFFIIQGDNELETENGFNYYSPLGQRCEGAIFGNRKSATNQNMFMEVKIDTTTDTIYCRQDRNDSLQASSVIASGVLEVRGVQIRSSDIGGNYKSVYVDNLKMWQGNFNDVPLEIVPSYLTMLISNDTDVSNPYNETLEEIDFYTFLNWTTGEVSINDTEGKCNISYSEDITVEDNSLFNNFTLCTTGCNYTSITDSFYIDETNNSLNDNLSNDIIEFYACHEQTANQNITIDVECGIGTKQIIINSNDFALCSVGRTPILRELTNCLGETDINITLSNIASNSERHRIEGLHYERVFHEHNILSTTNALNYNYSLNLWSVAHEHEYISNGIKPIIANCTHNTDSSLDNNVLFNLDVGEVAPLIQFNTLSNTNITVNLTNDIIIEYVNGTFVFSTTVTDTDLANVTYIIKNETDIIYSLIVTNPQLISVSGNGLFRDEGNNPYYFNVTATDLLGIISSKQINFNVSDFISPICIGFDNITNINNTAYTWNVNCYDESFFSLSVNCSNNYNFFIDGLDVTEYSFTGSTLITEDTFCNIRYCDGHTNKKIKPMQVSKQHTKNERMFNNKINLKAHDPTNNIIKFDTPYNIDRHLFELTFNRPTSAINWTFTSNEHIFIMNNPKYFGWLITGDYWTDFNSPDVKRYEIRRISDTEVIVDLTFFRPITEITFSSIGEKNCFIKTQSIESVLEGYVPLTNSEVREFDSLEQALFWIFLTFFWFISLLASLTIKGERGKKMGILILMQGFLAVTVGIGWLIHFNILVGLVILFVGTGVFLGSFAESTG